MAKQILHNPITGEVRYIDLMDDPTGAERAKLFQQGWLSGVPGEAPPSVYEIPQPPPVDIQPQPQMDALQPYIQNGQVDLIQVVRSGDTAAITQAENMFDYETMKEARYLAKMPVTKEAWEKLGPASKERARIVTPVSLEEWNRMSDEERAKHYVEGRGVGAGTYAKLGPATRRYFYPDLSIWEKLTTWKEEEGQKATTKAILLWEVDIAVPYGRVSRHWGELSNWERALDIVVDSTIVAALAAKPTAQALKTASQSVFRKAYGKTGANILNREIVTLDKAVVAGNQAAIKQSGQRLQDIGRKMVDSGIDSGKILVAQGKKITSQSVRISKHDINLAPQGRRITKELKKFAKGEVGGIELGPRRVWRGGRPEVKTAGLPDEPRAIPRTQAGGRGGGKRRVMVKERESADDFWRRLERDLERGRLREKGKKIEAEIERTAIREAERTGQFNKYLDALAKAARRLRGKEKERILRRIQEIRKKEKGKALASEIVRRARKNEERIQRMAKRTMDELKKMGISGQARKLRGMTTAQHEALFALDADTAYRLFSSLDTADRNELLSKLNPDLRNSIKNRALAKAQAQARAETKTEAVTKAVTDTMTKTLTNVKTDTKTELLTDVKVEQETKELVDIVPDVPWPTPTPTPPRDGTPPPPPPPPPDGKRDGRRRRRKVDLELEIKKVERVPKGKPGIVTFPLGIVDVKIKPPYRQGKADIIYVRRKIPAEGEGSPQRGLRTIGGKAPGLITISQGVSRIRIGDGKRMDFSQQHTGRGPGIMMPSGKVKKQRRRSMI